MRCSKNYKATVRDARVQEAVDRIQSSHFKLPYHTLKEMPDVLHLTLYIQLNGITPWNKAHKDQQILLHSKEKELVHWISQMTHINHAPLYSLICYMAKHIRSCQVQNINNQFIQLVHYEPLGRKWVNRFIVCHPKLKTIFPHFIEVVHIKELSYEAIKQYFDCVTSVIKEYNIQEENVYNMDKNRFAISAIEATKVIIDTQSLSNLKYYQAQPGQQK
jgi:hypothetical protein